MLVRKLGGAWEEPPVRAFDNEAALQQLLADAPQLVADLTSMAAVTIREIDVPSMGFLDVLVIRVDGELTLVEAKLGQRTACRIAKTAGRAE